MQKGKFIVFEGIDGSGKTTQAKKLFDKLETLKKEISLTAQPSKGKIGLLLREYLSGKEKAHTDVLALLFASDRLDHLLNDKNGVLKLINSGTNVVCDRNYFSSFAYQNEGEDDTFIVDINKKARQTLKPDLHIFIDVKPLKALERIENNRQEKDIFENFDKLEKVYNNYHKYFNLLKDEENILFIDGDRHEDVIAKDIFDTLVNLEIF